MSFNIFSQHLVNTRHESEQEGDRSEERGGRGGGGWGGGDDTGEREEEKREAGRDGRGGSLGDTCRGKSLVSWQLCASAL